MAGEGRYKQGKYDIKNPDKYKGTLPVFYRSSWEHRVFYFLDTKQNIKSWTSESIIIPYKYSVDQKMHRYFVDISFVVEDIEGNTKHFIIEIKPKAQTVPPKMPKTKNPKSIARYNSAMLEWQKNQDKWAAARAWANKNGYHFDIWTEEHLFGK